jgi:hypothetical protein
MTWVGTTVLHFEQTASVFGRLASCDRRFPVRELECLRFGTAITATVLLCRGHFPVSGCRCEIQLKSSFGPDISKRLRHNTCHEAANWKPRTLRDPGYPVNRRVAAPGGKSCGMWVGGNGGKVLASRRLRGSRPAGWHANRGKLTRGAPPNRRPRVISGFVRSRFLGGM